MRRLLVGSIGVLLAAAAGSQIGFGQQKVEMMPGFPIPVAPRGLWGKKLPDKPVEFDTAEGQRIRVVVVTKALAFPWTIAFLPDGDMLVTERAGRLRIIRNGVLDPKPIAGVPVGRIRGHLGRARRRPRLHGHRRSIRSSPRTSSSTSATRSRSTRSADRRRSRAGKWDGNALTETKDVFVVDRRHRHVARIAFGRDGMLYVTTSRRRQRRAGSEQPGRQGAAPQGRRHRAERQPVRRQGRRTSPRCTRSATAARSVWR